MDEDKTVETLEQIEQIEEKDDQQGSAGKGKKEEKKPPEKKYSDDDVDRIIEKKFARWQKEQQDAIDQAKKLADMSAAEKQAHELQELQKKVAKFEKESKLNEMTKAARQICAEKGVNVSDGILSGLVRADDAAETKENVDSFIKMVKDLIEKELADRLKGTTPKSGTPPAKVTKKEIMAIKDDLERRRMIAKHMELFQ